MAAEQASPDERGQPSDRRLRPSAQASVLVIASWHTPGDQLMRRVRGFTLLELMIVVGVIAILAAIALSAYNKQVRKSRRAEAKQTLSALSLREEKWRSNHAKYLGTDSVAADVTTFGGLPTSSFYDIAIATAESATDYTITATPKAGNDQAKDTCGTLKLQNVSGTVSKLPSTTGCW